MADSAPTPPIIQAWPLLLTTEMAALYLSIDVASFRSLQARMKINPVDVGGPECRWPRRELEKAAARLPKLDTCSGVDTMRPVVTLDEASIHRLANAVSARLGSSTPSGLPQLVSIREACVTLGVGRSTIYRLINIKKIDVQRIGRRTLIPRSEIERIQAQGIDSK